MSKNKRAPKELSKYVVVVWNGRQVAGIGHVNTQKEAKAWRKTFASKTAQLFKVNYDFYEEL